MNGQKKARDSRGLSCVQQSLFAFLNVNSKYMVNSIDINRFITKANLFVYTLEYTQINSATHFSLAASPNQAGEISI